KRHGWAKQIEVAKTKAPAVQSNAITPAEAAANVLRTRKDKSRLNLSKYVTDASRTAAKSQGDLTIARHVKDVAAVHPTLWPEEPGFSGGHHSTRARALHVTKFPSDCKKPPASWLTGDFAFSASWPPSVIGH